MATSEQSGTGISTTMVQIPVEERRGGPNKFVLVAIAREYTEHTEHGQQRVSHRLNVRCLHCNAGYNSSQFATSADLARINAFTADHPSACQRTGRTIPVESPEIGR